MHPALQGLLVGLVLGLILTGYEYYSVKKHVEDRAATRHEKPVFEPQDRARITAVARFSVVLPAGGAVMFWLWSMMG